MPRRSLVAAVAVAALAVLPSLARAATYTADAGADGSPGEPKQASSNAFFPRAVTVHQGDTVQWRFRGFHTVTFPAIGKQPPPLVVVDPKLPVSGQNDAAGNPFWFNGQPNVLFNRVAVTKSTTKTWSGSRVLGSGLPTGNKPKPFLLRFRRAGTFTYYCTVHPGMKGTVRVVSIPSRAPTPAQTDARRRREIRAYVAAAKRTAAAPPPYGTTVDVGRATSVFALYRMFPTTMTVNAGQTVTFTMAGQFRSEVHTVTFGPEKIRSGLEKHFITPIPGGPAGALGLNARGVYPSDEPPLPSYDGANHGDGFLNSGIIDNDPSTPFPARVTITFTKPGTYDYECVIHAHMDGRIVVR
ncbi:MAG: hypothetical protein E6G10_14635 [Actinobacteria bacterium]|nr:MAG: hypothetical protein E6G10_14635 [Actinomycetota bacterium]